MATYYVELNGGELSPKTTLKGGGLVPSVSFTGAVIYPGSGGGGANLETKSVAYTPSELELSQTLLPSAGYDGFDEVDVTVHAIPSDYVGSDIPLCDSSDVEATITDTNFIRSHSVDVADGYYENPVSLLNPFGSATFSPVGTPYVDPSTGDLTVQFKADTAGMAYTKSSYSITGEGAFNVKGAQTYTPGTTDQTIGSGYLLTGNQTILGDADLVAGNIKKDVEIFGVTGTYEGGGGGETWDIEWDYTDGNPTSNGFALTTGAGGGSATMESDYYSMKSGTSGGTYLVHSPNFTAAAGIMEFELYFPSLPAGTNGCIMSGPAFRYFVVGSNIKFFTTASTSVQVYSGIQANQWYKFKIEYSASEGANMWVNGVLVHTYTSALGYDGTRFMLNMGGGSGTTYVRRLAMVDANSISAQEAFSIIFGG